MTPTRRHILQLAGMALLACAPEPELQATPVDIAPDDACALDGMLIAEHEGPKAQLLRANGERALFCDAGEVFAEWLDPVRRHRIAGLWFQVLEEGPWEAHAGGWARAEDLIFVVGSQRMGAMGPTLAPFRLRASAERFVQQYGGTILRLDEIDATVMQHIRRQGIERWSDD